MNTILIVEDNVDTLETLSLFLEMSGYRVTVANDRDAALKILAAKNHRLVIVDLRMPGMTLVDFLAASKSVRPDTRFILTSSLPDAHTAAEARKHGIPYWLAKPFKPDDLLSVVEKVCSAPPPPPAP